MSETTYSLSEVAAMHMPAEIKNPVRWLNQRLARGELHGIRFSNRGPGSTWRMRESDIDYMLNRYSNNNTPTPEPVTVADGLSARSRRRLRTA
jgi:hypothetical protein